MASIVITEQDLTAIGSDLVGQGYVFIPGYANTNADIYILDGTDTPLAESLNLDTTIKYASNIDLQKSWTVSGESWTEDATYKHPKPENTIVLCRTIDEFEEAFGESPYIMAANQAYPATFSANAKPANINFYNTGDFERSYVYAKELLFRGIPVAYYNVAIRNSKNTDKKKGAKQAFSIEDFYSHLNSEVFDVETNTGILDKGTYNIEFITSGAYPVFEYNNNVITDKMLSIAKTRGDCVALIDHTDNEYRKLTGNTSVYQAIQTWTPADGGLEYSAMYTPWSNGNVQSVSKANDDTITQTIYPGSMAYLLAYAQSIKTNAEWLAVSGTTRGIVPINSLRSTYILSNTIANTVYQATQGKRINPITNISGYGLCIFGNSTLKDNGTSTTFELTAQSFMNIRLLVCQVKKKLYEECLGLLFEQNNDILWAKFLSKITPLLDRMKTGSGISNYRVIKNATKEKAKLSATVRLIPIYALEDIDINIELTNEDAAVQ